MAENVIINVNSELNNMKKHITDIDFYTSKVNEISENAKLYAVVCKINIMTIVSTVYALICAIMGNNTVAICIGVALIVLLVGLQRKENNKLFGVCVAINAIIVISSIIFFMMIYNLTPIIFIVIQWIITVLSNLRFKNKVLQISNSL